MTRLIQLVFADWPKQNPIFPAKPIVTLLPGAVTVVTRISLPLYVFLTESLANYFPRRLRTMRQRVNRVALLNESLSAAEEGKEIWPKYQRVISEMMGMRVSDIRKESRLYGDLKSD